MSIYVNTIQYFFPKCPNKWARAVFFQGRRMVILASFRICEALDAEALTFWPLQFQILQQWPRAAWLLAGGI